VDGDTAPVRLRADAARNRRLLLDAASAVFAEHGLDASMAEVAARAGVGKGTVFRHFASKEHLVASIYRDLLDQLSDAGATLLTAEDAGRALLDFMVRSVEMQAADRAFCQAAIGMVGDHPDVRSAADRLHAVAEELTARARDQGVVRADVVGTDVVLLATAAYQAAAPITSQPELWRRYLGVIFDGLRPEAAHPLDHPAPGGAPS
jgi:AcrR family transcriptional regulator